MHDLYLIPDSVTTDLVKWGFDHGERLDCIIGWREGHDWLDLLPRLRAIYWNSTRVEGINLYLVCVDPAERDMHLRAGVKPARHLKDVVIGMEDEVRRVAEENSRRHAQLFGEHSSILTAACGEE